MITNDVTVNVPVGIYTQFSPLMWRALVICLAEGKCEHCGNDDYLECHHIDGQRGNNCLANGMCLCDMCHHAWHNKYGKGKNYVVDLAFVNDRVMYLISRSEQRGDGSGADRFGQESPRIALSRDPSPDSTEGSGVEICPQIVIPDSPLGNTPDNAKIAKIGT